MTELTEIYFYPSEEFRLGEYKGIPLLFYDGYNKYRNDYFNDIFESLGFKKYYLRHDDDGDWVVPVTIENKFVWVNYCGSIFTLDSLDSYMENGWISLSRDEGYDIIGDDMETINVFEFINKYGEGSV